MLMVKTNPYFTAFAASLIYFVTFIVLKYLLYDKEIDFMKYLQQNKEMYLLSALIGAVVFWLVIFVVHQYINNRSDT